MLVKPQTDPNFPSGLSIQPSSSSTVAAATSSWDQDTQQDIIDYGIAGRIWEAAYLLARYLCPPLSHAFDPPCSIFASPEHVTAVEIGSGAGYNGLHLAKQLANHAQAACNAQRTKTVVLTDLPNVVPLMQRNARRACLDSDLSSIDLRVRPLSWGNEDHADVLVTELRCRLTHLICSDLVYFPELLPLLLRSLIHLSEPPSVGDCGPELIISYKIRSLVKEQPFWSALGSWFDYCAVNAQTCAVGQDQKDSWHRFGSTPADYNADSGDGQEYFLFVGRRQQDSLGCKPPANDSDLMQGKRCRLDTRSGTPEYRLELAPAQNDYFEWLLLSSMGSSLI